MSVKDHLLQMEELSCSESHGGCLIMLGQWPLLSVATFTRIPAAAGTVNNFSIMKT
jgi:hypothetical protein